MICWLFSNNLISPPDVFLPERSHTVHSRNIFTPLFQDGTCLKSTTTSCYLYAGHDSNLKNSKPAAISPSENDERIRIRKTRHTFDYSKLFLFSCFFFPQQLFFRVFCIFPHLGRWTRIKNSRHRLSPSLDDRNKHPSENRKQKTKKVIEKKRLKKRPDHVTNTNFIQHTEKSSYAPSNSINESTNFQKPSRLALSADCKNFAGVLFTINLNYK